jgi:predicted ribonuclease YlaK
MFLKRNNKTSYQYCKSEFAPETLEDHQFYGLELDEEQKIFRDKIWSKDTIAVICNAVAGVGKSTISLGVANLLVQYGRYNGIVYIMAPTQEQKQGYLPGGLEEKSAPYMQPLKDAMLTLGIAESCLIDDCDYIHQKSGDAYIKFTVDTYLRGCNLENKVIIIDEAENYYFDELKKVLTRIHDSCKVIIIGHDGQCDLYKHPERSGFIPYLNAFKEINDPRVAICTLSTNHRGWFSNFCDGVVMNKKI